MEQPLAEMNLADDLLAAAFYKVCAESATQPLKCSISLPVGVPSLIDVNGDNSPDMTVNAAILPGSTVPRCLSTPRICAALSESARKRLPILSEAPLPRSVAK